MELQSIAMGFSPWTLNEWYTVCHREVHYGHKFLGTQKLNFIEAVSRVELNLAKANIFQMILIHGLKAMAIDGIHSERLASD